MNFEDKIFKKLEKNKRNEILLRVINKGTPGYFHLKDDDLYEYIKERLMFMEPSFLEILGLTHFELFNSVSIQSHYIFGMINVVDSNNIFIYSSIKGNNEVSLKLNLEHLKRYSVFSGQVVAVKGKNIGNNEFITESIQCMPIVEVNTEQAKGGCRIRVISGVVEEISTVDVDVVVLIGVDLTRFKDSLEAWAKSSRYNKVVIVPFLGDDYSVNVFPQTMSQEISPYFTMCTNPAEIQINGKIISINTLDILQEMKKDEVSLCSGRDPGDRCGDVLFKGDQIDRLCYHAIFQRTYLPVIHSGCNVEFNFKMLTMKICPDIYILKSKIQPFQRQIGPTKVINIGEEKITDIEINS